MNIMSLVMGILLFGVLLVLYCLPSIIADKRKHRNKTAINALNLLLGWTLLGWVVALIWALSAQDIKTSASA